MSAPAAEKRASYLELFFDLVFVFAITQLAGLLHDDHSAGGWGHAALMAWLVWWAWSQYTWAGNAIDLDRGAVRVAVLVVSALVLASAVALPDAFGHRGAWFAIPYVAVRVAGLALYWFGLRTDPVARAALRTYVPIALVSPAVVLVGGLVGEAARPWVWTAAVAVDVASVLSAGRGEFRIAPAHFAERHALVVIIALGESIVAVGSTAAELEPSAALLATGAAGFAIAAVLWWAYFDRVQREGEHRLLAEPESSRGRLARDLYTLLHLPLVAGVVAFAVGVEEAVLHPDETLDTFGRMAVAVGIGLVLLAFVAAAQRTTGRVPTERVAALVAVLAVTAALGGSVSALVLLTALAAVLVLMVALEARRPARATRTAS